MGIPFNHTGLRAWLLFSALGGQAEGREHKKNAHSEVISLPPWSLLLENTGPGLISRLKFVRSKNEPAGAFQTLPSTYRNSISGMGINLQPSAPVLGAGAGQTGWGWLSEINPSVRGKGRPGVNLSPAACRGISCRSPEPPLQKWRCLLQGSQAGAAQRKA